MSVTYIGGIDLVGSYSEPIYRHSLSHSTPSAGPENGRFNDGLGIDLSDQGYLDHRGGQSSHQLMGHFPSRTSLRQTGNGAIGQLDSCLLHRALRRDKVPCTLHARSVLFLCVDRQISFIAVHIPDLSNTLADNLFQGDISEPNGVVNFQIGGSNDLHRNVVAHKICFQTQPSTPGLLLQIQGPEGSSGRRAINPLVRNIGLYIPNDIAHSQGHSESEQGRLLASTHSPVLS